MFHPIAGWIDERTTILLETTTVGTNVYNKKSRVYINFNEITIGSTAFGSKVYITRFQEEVIQMAIVVPKDEYISEVNAETTLVKDMSDEELAARQFQIETEFWKIRAREQAIYAEKQRRDNERKKIQKQEDKQFVNPTIGQDTQKELAEKLAAQIVAMKEMGLPQASIDQVKALLAGLGKNVPTLHAEVTKKE